MPFPSFAGFDRIMIEQMQRQSQEMMRRAREMSRHSGGAAPYLASYGDMPAGQASTTVVTISNNWPDLHPLDRGRVARAGQAAEGHVERQRPVRGGGRTPTGPIHRT